MMTSRILMSVLIFKLSFFHLLQLPQHTFKEIYLNWFSHIYQKKWGGTKKNLNFFFKKFHLRLGSSISLTSIPHHSEDNIAQKTNLAIKICNSVRGKLRTRSFPWLTPSRKAVYTLKHNKFFKKCETKSEWTFM